MSVEGAGHVTISSEDEDAPSDMENWELSNAYIKDGGEFVCFLPECIRNSDGSLTVLFGTYESGIPV